MSNFLTKYNIVSTVAAIWAMWLFTEVTLTLFETPKDIHEWSAAAYATFFAVLGIAWKFYMDRNQGDKS